MKKFDVIIIGGGAAGLMCAAHIGCKNVLLLEAGSKYGQKIAISGGGRCNVTNRVMEEKFFRADEEFISHALKFFSNNDLLTWLKNRGLELTLRPNGCYFCPLKASQMVELLVKEASQKATLMHHQPVEKIEKTNNGYRVVTHHEVYEATSVVLATGGVSYPLLGANDSGMKMGVSLGHTLTTLAPALVGWTLQKEQFWMKELSGISLPVKLSLYNKTLEGDWLFAHKGVSGPVVLNGSLYWEKGVIEVDFLPHTTIEACVKKGGNKFVSGIFGLPKRFIDSFLHSLGLKDAPYKTYTEAQKELLSMLKNYRFSPAGNFGYSKAEATRGGIATQEIDPLTMQSRLCEGLYFLGEMVDVTGEVGGYNFQWAFSSAVVAAQHITQG